MIIDILVAVAFVMAVIKGFQKGFIIAVFSVVAFIAGIAAALKLSASVAAWLGTTTNIGTRWLPFLSFLLVFIAVVLLVRLGAKFIEGAVTFVLLGWLNKILGIILYAVLYIIILSVFLFYTQQMNVFAATTIQESVTYPYIIPWAPKVIDAIGTVIPWFKDLFQELGTFFGTVNEKISA
ncbi:MAG: CvpA family protein [Chitinophagaceae bacterium]|nr:CvpA family protein [Chitinophagaceae bacterium]